MDAPSQPSLQDGIDQAGSPMKLLWQQNPAPWNPENIDPEYAGWRTEQHAWHDAVALSDVSHHMFDTFIEGPDATAHPFGELARRLGVVDVVVGEQHGGNIACRCRDRVEVSGLRRARVDHDRPTRSRLTQHPCVASVEGHHVGIGREHALRALAERSALPTHAQFTRARRAVAGGGRASRACRLRPPARVRA